MSSDIELGKHTFTPPSVGWDDMVSSSMASTKLYENASARVVGGIDAYDQRNSEVERLTGKKLFNPLRDAPDEKDAADIYRAYKASTAENAAATESRTEFTAKWMAKKHEQALRDIETQFPQHAPLIRSGESPILDHERKAKAAELKMSELSQAAGMVSNKDMGAIGKVPLVGSGAAMVRNLTVAPEATIASFWGGFKAQMQDPFEASLNLIPFGLATSASKSLLSNALRNAVSNAALESAVQPLRQSNKAAIGVNYGWEDALSSIEGAAVTGGILDFAIRGPARAALKQFGRDVAPDEMLSKHGRGGLLTDAIEQTPVIKPVAREQITPDEIKRAETGDIDAIEAIATKTGAIEDPAVKGAIDHTRLVGPVDEAMVKRMQDMRIDYGEGMAQLAAAIRGEYHRHAEPVPQAKAPLDTEAAKAILGRVDELDTKLADLDATVRRQLIDALDTGAPEFLSIARSALDGDKAAVAKAIEDAGGMDVLSDRITVHGSNDPVAVAGAIRRSPQVLDSNIRRDTEWMQTVVAISRLDQAAFNMVANGDVNPRIAVMVSNGVPPGKHAAVMTIARNAEPDDVKANLPDLIPDDVSASVHAGPKMADPVGAEAKAQTEGLAKSHADEVEAQAAITKQRETLTQQIEDLRGQIAKGVPEPAPKKVNESAIQPDERTIIDQALQQYGVSLDQIATMRLQGVSFGDVIDGVLGRAMEAPAVEAAPKLPPLDALHQTRVQLRELEQQLDMLEASQAKVADNQPLLRMVMQRAALQRAIDIRRAIDDALRLGARILPEDTKLDVRSEEMFDPASGHLLDAYSDMASGDIALSMHAMDPAARIGHETVHTLRTRGHISAQEIASLADLARESGTFKNEAEYRTAYTDRAKLDELIQEEAAASYIEARIKGEVTGPENTSINRIKQLMERIRNALNGYGFTSRDDVVRTLLSGDMARREANAEWMRNAQVEGRSEMKAAAERGVTLPDGTEIKGVSLYAIRAYHGSPHDFDRFDMNKIGTGEGAQAFGHGLYFAGNEDVAKHYRRTLSLKGHGTLYEVNINVDPNDMFDLDLPLSKQNDRVKHALAKHNLLEPLHVDEYIKVSRANNDLNEALKGFRARLFSRSSPIERDLVKAMKDKAAPGYEHSVREIARQLDGPIGDAARSAHDAIERFTAAENSRKPMQDPDGKAFIDPIFGSENIESKLKSAGIPGIRYFDQMSRDNKSGTYNYVVFDDSLIEIVAKDGKLVRTQDQAMRSEDITAAVVKDGKMFALSDRDTGRSMRAALDGLGYYSKLDEVLKTFGLKDVVTKDTLLKRGVKQAELDARGLGNAFDGGGVRVGELKPGDAVRLNEKSYDRSPLNATELANLNRNNGSADDLLAAELGLGTDPSIVSGNFDRTKWSRHSLDPSNPSYRETVLHLPSPKPEQLPDGSWKFDGVITDSKEGAMRRATANDFRSGHFPEPNIVGHMMSSLNKHDGKNVYTLDQIQSDWGQKLRDGGVRDEAKINEIARALDGARAAQKSAFDDANKFVSIHLGRGAAQDTQTLRNNLYLVQATPPDGKPSRGPQFDGVPDSAYKFSPQVRAETKRLDNILGGVDIKRLEAELSTAQASASGHPLVNTTDQWTNTTLRRAIRQAVEADADFIAIPHGDTVLSYNPGDTDGMRGFYGSRTSEGIVPKNLRKLLEKIDKDSAKPTKVETLDTPSGTRGYKPDGESDFDKNNTGFTIFPLTAKVNRSIVDEGQALFALAGERGADRLASQRMGDAKQAIAMAKELEVAGKSRDEIWKATADFLQDADPDGPMLFGVYKGGDGKWRVEFDEYDLTANVGKGAGRDVVFHPTMDQIYPEYKNTKFEIIENMPKGKLSGYAFGTMKVQSKTDGVDMTASVLAHELQHLIQNYEGFARGGSPDTVKVAGSGKTTNSTPKKQTETKPPDAAQRQLEDSIERLRINLAAAERLDRWHRFFGETAKTSLGKWWHNRKHAQALAVIEASKRAIQEIEGRGKDTDINVKPTRVPVNDTVSRKEKFDAYQRLAGEAEARNVQTRMSMSPDMRRETPPWKTLDVPESELTYVFGPKRNELDEAEIQQMTSDSNDDVSQSLFALAGYRTGRNVHEPDAVPIESIGPTDKHPGKILAFHGSPKRFDTFDPDKIAEFGFHFGSERAASTARDKQLLKKWLPFGGNVRSVVLDIKNPILVRDVGRWDSPFTVAYYLKKDGGLNIDWQSLPKKGAPDQQISDGMITIKTALADQGFDGIRYINHQEGAGSWSYIVWNKGQVKSATTSNVLMALSDRVPDQSADLDPPSILQSDLASVDRMGVLKDLIEACR